MKRSKSVGGTGMMLFSLGDPNFLKFKEVHEDYSARIVSVHMTVMSYIYIISSIYYNTWLK